MKKLIPKLMGGYLNAAAWVAPAYVGKLGYEIFCTPLAPKVKRHHKVFLDTAEQFDFTSGEVTLRAYRWGTGPKRIVFLHGWQSHTYRWKKYIQSFSTDEFTLLAFDAPAHGLSGGRLANIPLYSEAIQSFFQTVGPADAVVSHSMGSFSMLHALHHNPAIQVGKIIAMGSPGEANDFITFYKAYTGINDRTFQFILNYFVEKLNQTPDYFSAPRFASTLDVPGVIIHDKGDEEAPYHHAQRIHAAWKNSQLITTEGMGHNFKKKEAVKMVRDFISNESLVALH
ncbi:MAG: alpha/beta fold hydrolase [Cyclobacteriaceae bacterium]